MTLLTDGKRPNALSAEFRPYFEAVISFSQNLAEAKERMGYTDSSSVRYHMKKFGIKPPAHWTPKPSPRPSARGPQFRSYFEGVLNSSTGMHEAAEKMGYATVHTVVYHMRRLGIEKPNRWEERPSGYSPEFKEYFQNVVNSCQSVTEATKKLGYTRPASVRYNMKRFGIKTPDSWYSQPDMLRRPRDPGFRAYFESVVKSNKSPKEVMEKMQYTSPNSVWYQMRKQGIAMPDSWHGRPNPRGSEFAAYFENVIKTSKTVKGAVQRLNYANTCMVYHHIKRLGLEVPRQWGLKPWVGMKRSERIPKVIFRTEKDGSWVAALHQGEGCLTAHYSKGSDETALALVVAMTDSTPIFHFCDLCGVARPQRPKPRADPLKPIWVAAVGGLRAYRVVQEILPYLMGQKLEEAKRALKFFGPSGYRKGRHSAYDIWPDGEFPLRRRGLARYAQSLMAKLAASDLQLNPSSGESRAKHKLDTTCLRIADVLLEVSPSGLGLVEIMNKSGASWTAAVHHVRHLEDNSLVLRERIPNPGHRGPRLIFKANHRLAELRGLGWVLDLHDD